MKKIINFLMYGKYNRKTFLDSKDVIDENNYKRLILFCFIGSVINLVLFMISIFLHNDHINEGSHICLIMLFVSVFFILGLNWLFKNNKKHITFLFYLYVLISLFCFETLDVNYSLNTPACLITMIYMLSAYLFLDPPGRYGIITLIFTLILCYDTFKLKPIEYSVMDITNCLIAYFIGVSVSYYQFGERIGKVLVQKRLERERDTDFLTGLNNRIVTQKDISKSLANKTKNKSVMLVLDLDDFKYINDTYGHIKGDEILQRVADAMRRVFRKDDYISRVGGDEFVIFLPSIPSKEFAEEKVKSLIKNINDIKIDKNVFVSCSIGVVFPKTSKNYSQLFKKADYAMYQAKKSGKNCYKIYKHSKGE